jgi:hypothetical protein
VTASYLPLCFYSLTTLDISPTVKSTTSAQIEASACEVRSSLDHAYRHAQSLQLLCNKKKRSRPAILLLQAALKFAIPACIFCWVAFISHSVWAVVSEIRLKYACVMQDSPLTLLFEMIGLFHDRHFPSTTLIVYAHGCISARC